MNTTTQPATTRQLSYLSYLIQGFKANEGLTKQEASRMIRNALKGSNTKSAKKEKTKIANKYGVKVGDVFAFSFGYDATLYCFFQVIRIVSPTMVEIAEIGTKTVEGEGRYGPCSWKSTPNVGGFLTSSMWYEGKTALKRVSVPSWDPKRGACLSFKHNHTAYKVDPNGIFDEDDYH